MFPKLPKEENKSRQSTKNGQWHTVKPHLKNCKVCKNKKPVKFEY